MHLIFCFISLHIRDQEQESEMHSNLETVIEETDGVYYLSMKQPKFPNPP